MRNSNRLVGSSIELKLLNKTKFNKYNKKKSIKTQETQKREDKPEEYGEDDRNHWE